MARVFIPPALRPLTDGQEAVEVPGATVAEVIENLNLRFPGTKDRLCSKGSLRPGMSVVIGAAVSALGLLQHVAPDAEVHFLPSIGGG